MKIMFLCGSLEPGQDGVGDYTRRLAGEIKRLGHEVFLLALKDRSVSRVMETEQLTQAGKIHVLRLPTEQSSKRRYARAQEVIMNFDPDWLSLQYVPFSFQKKGLPFTLGHHLARIGKGRKWHVMYHELWLGMEKRAKPGDRIIGLVQQQIIRRMMKDLKPIYNHTQSGYYRYHLQKIGAEVGHLPLFSNIPKTEVPVENHTKETNKPEEIVLVIFGSIHPSAPVKQLCEEVAEFSKEQEIVVSLKLLGRCGAAQEDWLMAWRAAGMKVKVHGEQSPERISEILQTASGGISTTPWVKIEKSGAVAAMLEHGLPVLCVARDWHPRESTTWKLPKGVMQYQQGNLKTFLTTNAKNHKPSSSLQEVSLKLADIFSTAM